MKRFGSVLDDVSLTSAFATLLSPMKAEDFFCDYWDCKSVYFAGRSGRFDQVMTNNDFVNAVFDAKLSSRNLRYLQKSIGDRQESLDLFLRQKATWNEPQSMAQLAKDLHGGTLIYVAIENSVPSAKTYCRSLFADLKCQMSINAYFSTGRDASAFDAHFDPQDVFILQLEGEKEWRLWGRERVSNPVPGVPDGKSISPPPLPADETVLMKAGDLLYVPRGMWHWPRSLGDDPSLHLTLTLVMPKPIDIMQWLTQIMSEEENFRASLPFSQHQDGAKERSDSLDQAIAFLSQTLASPNAKAMATAYMLREGMRTVMPKAGSASKDDKEL